MTRPVHTIADARTLVQRGLAKPSTALPELRRLAASEDWRTREVAATALVAIAKRHPRQVLASAKRWARSRDARIRRAACEGLRGLVKRDPESVRPILELMQCEPDPYARKSVASLLRNASGKHPDFVKALSNQWKRSEDANCRWIAQAGSRKLVGRDAPRDTMTPRTRRKPGSTP